MCNCASIIGSKSHIRLPVYSFPALWQLNMLSSLRSLAAPPSRPRAKPTSKVEDFVPEGDVDGFFEEEEEEEEEEDDEEEDRYVWNALVYSIPRGYYCLSVLQCHLREKLTKLVICPIFTRIIPE